MKLSQCSAIILAGGQAKRMGQDKRFLTVKRRPLLEQQVDVLGNLFDEVIISANDPERLAYIGVQVFPDEWPEGGPMAGLATGLRHVSNEWAFVLAVDIPEPNQELLGLMCAQKSEAACVPRHTNGDLEPLHALYNQSLRAGLEDCLDRGDYALYRFLMKQAVSFVDLPTGMVLTNLNSPEDYERFEGK